MGNQYVGMREGDGSGVPGKKGESVSGVSALISPDDWMDGCEAAEMIANNSL